MTAWIAALSASAGISPRELRQCTFEDLHALSDALARRAEAIK